MRTLKYLALGVVTLAALFVVVGFALPSDYAIERSVVIDGSPEAVHEYVGDLERWSAWEPWTEEDPTIRVRRSENTTGAGAHQSWTGDSGSGELTITENSPSEGVAYDLTFDGEYECKASLRYAAGGDGTRVTWSMTGDYGMNLIGRYFGLFMDSMAGPMFERGLEKLKQAVEAG